jgi:hypothetical protein
MLRHSFRFPLTVSYRDPASLFAIEATLTESSTEDGGTGGTAVMTLTIGLGTLHDADKGPFAIDGLRLTLRVTRGRLEPVAVLNPGSLSEFQQAGLLDAISNFLNRMDRMKWD